MAVDKNKLSQDLARWGNGVGMYATQLGVSVSEAVRLQTGFMVRELVESLPPTSRGRLEKKIAGDARSVFQSSDSVMFRGKQRGKDDMVWMNAGPTFLTGVKREQYRQQSSAAEMIGIYKANKGKLGNRYTKLGNRGKQHVQRLNRFVVKKSALNRFVKIQQGKTGKLKASVALAWNALAIKGRRPARWIARHIEARTAKGSFSDSTRHGTNPSFTIISNQAGVGKPFAISIIRSALRRRIKAMVIDVTGKLKRRKK